MIWLEESGLLDVRREEVIRLAGRIPPRGVFGSEHTISLQALGAQGIVLLGRLSGVADGGRLSFADDVEANVRNNGHYPLGRREAFRREPNLLGHGRVALKLPKWALPMVSRKAGPATDVVAGGRLRRICQTARN
ncbi:hypothetical protein ACVJBD_001498 [Rhizobium mongolense]